VKKMKNKKRSFKEELIKTYKYEEVMNGRQTVPAVSADRELFRPITTGKCPLYVIPATRSPQRREG